MALRRGISLTRWLMPSVLVAGILGPAVANAAQTGTAANAVPRKARISKAVAFDVSPTLRALARHASAPGAPVRIRQDRGPVPIDRGFAGDAAVQSVAGNAHIGAPAANFEGLSNADNPFEVQPPDPNGEVGPNNFIEMVNIVFAVYSKTGARQLGPLTLGTLWRGFAVDDCTDPSGDPVVLYDQLANRWILTQFTTRGPIYYNCVAVSATGDPTGAYFRYAFSTGLNFPDYPKYGVWPDAHYRTTRSPATVRMRWSARGCCGEIRGPGWSSSSCHPGTLRTCPGMACFPRIWTGQPCHQMGARTTSSGRWTTAPVAGRLSTVSMYSRSRCGGARTRWARSH
jgi:hypothetical protein